METMLIREETPPDFKEIYRLIKTGFETAKVNDGTEQDFSDRLRASDGYVPELGMEVTPGALDKCAIELAE